MAGICYSMKKNQLNRSGGNGFLLEEDGTLRTQADESIHHQENNHQREDPGPHVPEEVLLIVRLSKAAGSPPAAFHPITLNII